MQRSNAAGPAGAAVAASPQHDGAAPRDGSAQRAVETQGREAAPRDGSAQLAMETQWGEAAPRRASAQPVFHDATPPAPRLALMPRLPLRAVGAVLALVAAQAGAQGQAGTLSLEQALSVARDRQPALRQARAGQEVAVAQARAAFAPILPTASLGLGYQRSTRNFVARPGTLPSGSTATTSLSLASSDYWTGNLTLSGTLWDFGQNWNRYQAALSQAEAQAASVHAAEVAADLSVRTAFFAALAQKALVDVAQAALDNTQAQLKQVQGFVTVGARPEIDLAQSRADAANARLQLLNARTASLVAKAKLNQAMGVAQGTAYEVVGEGEGAQLEGEASGLEALWEEGAKARPEVAALEAQVRAQELTLRAIRGAYWPTLGAQVQGTVATPDLATPVPNISAAVTLNWAFWQGGVTAAQARAGERTLEQLAAQRDGLLLQVRLDVEQASLNLASAKEAVGVSREALEAAREQLRLAEGRYKAGAGSALELSTAQLANTTAGVQVISAQLNVATARAQLLAALGRR